MDNKLIPYEDRIKWFHEARFGMFIHWGLYSLLKKGEWVMWEDRITPEEYAPLAQQFNPVNYDANDWAKLAVDAGQKYMVLTTRHHDGFCLYDSKVSDFTAPKTAAKRDLIAEYVDAARKHGLKVGLYYSLLDWRFCEWPGQQLASTESLLPASAREPMVEQAHAQVRELMTNYGKIDMIWFDGQWVSTSFEGGVGPYWEAPLLVQMIRELQPGILISDAGGGNGSDFEVAEQHLIGDDRGRAWEACMTIANEWGYTEFGRQWKSPIDLLVNLCRAASRRGNLLLNVGPKPDGTIRQEERDRLLEMGRWLKTHGEAVYGSERPPRDNWLHGPITRKGNDFYYCLFNYPGAEAVLLPQKGYRYKSAMLLDTGQELKLRDEGHRTRLLGLPATPPDPIGSVAKVTMEKE